MEPNTTSQAPAPSKLRDWLIPLVYFANNLISLIGVVLLTAATIFWIFLLPQLLRGEAGNPYIGIFMYVLLPAIFFAGLALIPAGVWLHRRAREKAGKTVAAPLTLDLQSAPVRHAIAFLAAASLINVAIASQLTYSAVNYVEGQEFCGTTCHVMKPEYSAYRVSAHSNVECVKCHAGPGVSGFVKSKMAGMVQLYEVILNSYPRPIPAPSRHNLTSQQTCQNCHAPNRAIGDRLKTIPKFADDDQNSRTDSVVLLHIGSSGTRQGIHGAHFGQGVKLEFAPRDSASQKISWVRRTVDGKTTIYTSDSAAETEPSDIRSMDCMDCHNRPAHTYELPDRAIDKAMATGSIPTSLPQAKKQALALLNAKYGSNEEAGAKIIDGFLKFYQSGHPEVSAKDKPAIEEAAHTLAAIYNRNVFPDMKVTWGSYPNNIGHNDSPGCFRCHDDLHVSTDKRKIGQDCTSCHGLIAMDETKPKILTELGIGDR